MSNAIKISFIIPCYNGAEYIPNCLNSIFSQGILESEYEIICIDDCSTDNSIEVIKNYQKKHPNIVLIEQEKNQKQGAARNIGVSRAKGDYFVFVDVDDTIVPNSYEKLLPIIEQNRVDILTFKFNQQNDNGIFVEKGIPEKTESEIMTGKEFLSKHYDPQYILSPWIHIYNKKYWSENKFLFAENVFWEDADLIAKCVFYAQKIKFAPIVAYNWHYNNASTSRTLSGKKLADMVKMANRKYRFSREIINEDADFSKKMKEDAIWNATCIRKVIFLSNKERKFFYNELSEDLYSGIVLEVKNKKLKFLYYHRSIVTFFLYFISPVLKILKN